LGEDAGAGIFEHEVNRVGSRFVALEIIDTEAEARHRVLSKTPVCFLNISSQIIQIGSYCIQ
jgi:hypothetical protein